MPGDEKITGSLLINPAKSVEKLIGRKVLYLDSAREYVFGLKMEVTIGILGKGGLTPKDIERFE